MKYTYQYTDQIPQGKQIYNSSEYSLDFENLSKPTSNCFSLSLAKTLQFEVDIDSLRMLYCWGYAPHTNWEILNEKYKFSKVPKNAALYVDVGGIGPALGTAYETDLINIMPRFYKTNNTLVIGDSSELDSVFQVAEGLYVYIRDEKMTKVVITLNNAPS